jgi:hypothetical protein
MLKIAEMASRGKFFQSVLSLFLLFTIVGQGPIVGCVAIRLSSASSPTVTSGAHCPLMLASNTSQKSMSHHCDMQQRQLHRQCEIHCACHTKYPTPRSDNGFVRYVLPHVTPLLPTSNGGWLWQKHTPLVFSFAFSPPDPPPRFLLV